MEYLYLIVAVSLSINISISISRPAFLVYYGLSPKLPTPIYPIIYILMTKTNDLNVLITTTLIDSSNA